MTISSINSYNPYTNYPKQSFNFRSNPVYNQQPDRVELSTLMKSRQEKEKSRTKKLLLGITGGLVALYGCFVAHKAFTKPSLEKVQKNLSEIFRCNLSKEEAEKLVNQYKELFKIKDKDEFINKAYKQVKKDYGYENLNIPLKFEERTGDALGFWHPMEGSITINSKALNRMPKNLKPRDKKNIMRIIVHEFQHVKQAEYCYRTNPKEYLDALYSDKISSTVLNWLLTDHKTLMTKELLNRKKDLFKTEEDVHRFMNNVIKKINDGSWKSNKYILDLLEEVKHDKRQPVVRLFKDYEKFDKTSENYQQGLKYLENRKNHISLKDDKKGYREQLLEKEAYATEGKLKILYKYMQNIFKL